MADAAERMAWVAFYRQTGDAGATCRRYGISRPTLRKWTRRFAAAGAAGLASRSHAPLAVKRRAALPDAETLILRARQDRGLGLRRLQAALRQDHGIALGLNPIRDVLSRHAAPAARPGRPRRSHASPPPDRLPLRLPALPDGDDLAARLAEAITLGHLRPGRRLPEEALCKALAAGRLRVRQALRELAAIGLVSIVPYRGAFVARPSPRTIAEAYAARRLLEAEIAADVAQHCAPADIAALRRHVQAQQAAAAGGRARLIRLLTEFHLLLAAIGGSRVIEEIVSRLVAQTSVAVLLHDTATAASCGVADHAALVDLIAAGDAQGAATLMRRHLADNQNRLRFAPEAGHDAAHAPAPLSRPAGAA